MRHYLGLCVALGLIASVTTATTATAGPPKARVEVVINQDGVSYINLTANGTNGLLKGTGTMKIGKAATYPMTIESGTFTSERSTSSSGGSSSGGGSGGSTSSVNGTVTLNGFIRRQGRKVPFVLEGETESGDATLTCTVTTTTTSGGTTTTTSSDVDSDWTGRIRIKF